MEKEFISYTEALALKELGFDEPCFGSYIYHRRYKEWFLVQTQQTKNASIIFEGDISVDGICIASPLYQQAFRWLREKYNLRGFIGFRPNVKQFDCHVYDMSLSGKEYVKQRTMEEFNKDPKVGTYEEAELECLKKLIEIVKNK